MTGRADDPWHVERLALPAGDFHRLEPSSSPRRAAWVNVVPTEALVLGSTQPERIVDTGRAAHRRVDVVRRRSGGGAVLVTPASLCWVDVVVPRDDPLWDDDVGRAMHWVGRTWQRALASLGVTTRLHTGAMTRTPWSSVVCFAGRAPGELVGAGGGKVVGVAQRRTRGWARLQTAALVEWEPDRLVDLLAPPLPARPGVLADVASGIGIGPEVLTDAFVAELPGGVSE